MTFFAFERTLRSFISRKPFRPFLIELDSGDRIEIRHPEAIYRSSDVFVSRGTNREQRVFATEAVVQFIDPAAQA